VLHAVLYLKHQPKTTQTIKSKGKMGRLPQALLFNVVKFDILNLVCFNQDG